MISVEVTNTAAVIQGLDRHSQDARIGASRGIEMSVQQLAADVRQHTPVKTGKARDAVYGKMLSQLVGAVGYGSAVKWYMRIVELSGAKPHDIPKDRGPAKQTRARQSKQDLIAALRAAGVDSGRLGDIRKSLGLRHRRALFFGGRFASKVHHPGIKSLLTLRSQLSADQAKIQANVRAGIAAALAPDKAGWESV